MAINYRRMTRNFARRYGIPEDLAIAQIGAESGFNPRAVSSAGAQGLAQFMPATARGLGLRDPFNPKQALNAYGKHMSTLLKNYKGNTRLALAAYNAGSNAVSRAGNRIPQNGETPAYVSKILKQINSTGGIPTPSRPKRGAGGGTAPVQSAGDPRGSLQLDARTQKMIEQWAIREDKAQSKGQYGKNDKLFQVIVNRLQKIPKAQSIASSAQPQGAVAAVGSMAQSAAQTLPDAGGGKLRPILPGQPAWGGYGYADPEGQGGRHLAVDWFAKHGTPVKAPISGKIVRVSASKGNSGQVFGGVVSLRDSSGRLFVMRHIDPGKVRVGMKVGAGQVLGTPTAWRGGQHHIHFEAYGKGSSDREYTARYALNPKTLYG